MAGPTIEEQRAKIRLEKENIVKQNTLDMLKNNILVREMLVRGIYFLYKNNKVVYIGKSDENVMSRICDHFKEGVKDFDSFSIKKRNVSKAKLDKIESSLIKRLKPKYNIVHNSRNQSRKVKIIYGRSRIG